MRPMLHHARRFAQSGFTLVEMAIVLVIVGLLLGGVLKGQELIENARVKEAANIIKNHAAAYYAYMDRYGNVPGDDGPVPVLQARGGSWTQVIFGGNLNGVIDTPPLSELFSGSWEEINFYHHLRAGGFIKGDLNLWGVEALPKHPWGGLVSVTSLPAQGRSGFSLKVCMRNVPSKGAAALDRLLDDAIPNTGTLRANTGQITATGVATSYQDGQMYTICQEI